MPFSVAPLLVKAAAGPSGNCLRFTDNNSDSESEFGGFDASVCAYAPQVGCEEEVKEDFWRQLERVYGGWGVGETNAGERLIDFAVAFDLTIVNTFYEKKTIWCPTVAKEEKARSTS